MVLGNRVKGHLFQGNRGTISATFEGDRQTKKILGNMEHREIKFSIFKEQGNKQIYFTGPCTPPPPARTSMVSG